MHAGMWFRIASHAICFVSLLSPPPRGQSQSGVSAMLFIVLWLNKMSARVCVYALLKPFQPSVPLVIPALFSHQWSRQLRAVLRLNTHWNEFNGRCAIIDDVRPGVVRFPLRCRRLSRRFLCSHILLSSLLLYI